VTPLAAVDYDGWYDTERGMWIGETEYRLLLELLEPQPGEVILDVGCGTGWFTRRLAALPGARITGADINGDWLRYARGRDAASVYVEADARHLPFDDKHVDRTVSVTALSFVDDWPLAIREIVRVTRSRFAIALLNRDGLLWREKGQGEGRGAYRGAHWHTADELRPVLDALPVRNVQYRTAVFLPSGSDEARLAENLIPTTLPWGSILVVAGDVSTS